MFRNKCLLLFFATLCSYGGSGSHTTLQLPITINPLIQDAIQRSNFTDELIQLHETFFENVTLSDIIKSLDAIPSAQVKKDLAGLVVLGLAAMANGLTVEQFEFIQTSKWTIIMSVEELVDVSNNITLPLNDKTRFIIIQEAMFKVLEKRFNFNTKEIAERLNTTKDKIYEFLEPGWIKVVNFITEKNILALSTNYTIPPFYIAEALNMSLSELYNSTLPQLEDILVNKIDIIKEAAERWKRIVSSSIAGLLRVSSTPSSAVMSTMMLKNSTESIAMKQTTTMAIEPRITSQTGMKTSSINISTPSVPNMMYTSSSFTDKLESSPTIAPQSSSMPGMTSSIGLTIATLRTVSSSTSIILSSVIEKQISTPKTTKTRPVTSTYNTYVPMTTTQVPQEERSSTLPSEMKSSLQQVSTTQMSMLHSTTTEAALPTSTEVVSTVTSKSSIITESSKMSNFVNSKSSDLSQRTTSEITMISSNVIKISITQHTSASEIQRTQNMNKSSTRNMTSTEILPTAAMDVSLSAIIETSFRSVGVSVSRYVSSSIAGSTQSTTLENLISSADTSNYHRSETVNIDGMKSSLGAKSLSITTTVVLMTSSSQPLTSSNGKNTLPTTKLSSFSHLTPATKHPSYAQTSIHIPQYRQTSSSHFVMDTSVKTKEVSTSSRNQQPTKIPESSPGPESSPSSATDAFNWKTTIFVTPSSYHTNSLHGQATTTPVTPAVGNRPDARSEDDIDPAVLIVIPIMGVLLLVAVVIAFVMWIRRRRQQKIAGHKNAESGSELSTKGLTDSLENINNNRTTGFANRGSDDRSSRSMSRSSSISNLGTIYEGNEPEEPEIYDL